MNEANDAMVFTRGTALSKVGNAIGAIVVNGGSIGMAAVGLYFLLQGNLAIGLIMLALGLFLVRVGKPVVGEASTNWFWRLEVAADGLNLRLPAGRTYLHDLEWFEDHIPRESIVAIVSRFEGYGSIGGANIQQVFALQLVNGHYLHLGEDRAVGTALYKPFYKECVKAIAERYQLPLVDLGTVTSYGGFLGLLGIKVPAWDTVGADDGDVNRIWQSARRTGTYTVYLAIAILLWQGLKEIL